VCFFTSAGLISQILIFRQVTVADGFLTFFDQPGGGGVDRQLELRLGDGVVDLLVEGCGHG